MTDHDRAGRHSAGVGYLRIKPDPADPRDTVLTIHDAITHEPWAHIVYSPGDLREVIDLLKARLDFVERR